MAIAALTSASGLDAAQSLLDVTSNNLANANTTAFKSGTATFADLLYDTIAGVGRAGKDNFTPVGIQAGNGVRIAGIASQFAQGTILPTGGQFDLAIDGAGFFQLRRSDGTVVYSREGTFTLDATGRLVNSDGLPLVPPIVIPPGTVAVGIGNDGTVTATPGDGGAPVAVGRITLARFVNPAGLFRLGDSLFTATAASGAAQVGAPGTQARGILRQSALETSNVNVTAELVNLLVAQRAFSINSSALGISIEILRTAAQLIPLA